MSTTERRLVSSRVSSVAIEKRSDGGNVLRGHAAVFYNAADPGTEFNLCGDIWERVLPTAFNRAIAEKDDCRALVNHDPAALLGRTLSGTCRLSVDSKGLLFEVDMPDTQIGRDTVTSIARGDLTGCSFSFSPESVVWEDDGDRMVRGLQSVRLFDVSICAYPAYESSTCGIRADNVTPEARSIWTAARDAWKAEHAPAAAPVVPPEVPVVARSVFVPTAAMLRMRQRLAEVEG